MNTTDVENFPGFPDGVLGPDLMDQLRKQAERFGAELVADDVTEVDLKATPKLVTAGEDTFYARTVILATGSGVSRARRGPREATVRPWRVLVRDMRRILLPRPGHCGHRRWRHGDGGGDVPHPVRPQSVTIVHRRDSLRASKIMEDRAGSNPKIKLVWNSEVVEILGDDRVTGLRLRDLRPARRRDLAVAACSSRSATIRAASWSRASRPSTTRATSRSSTVDPHQPRRRVRRGRCRRPRLTVRPSRPPAPAARQRWTPSAGWQTMRNDTLTGSAPMAAPGRTRPRGQAWPRGTKEREGIPQVGATKAV